MIKIILLILFCLIGLVLGGYVQNTKKTLYILIFISISYLFFIPNITIEYTNANQLTLENCQGGYCPPPPEYITKGDEVDMDTKSIIEIGAYGVMLYLFVCLLKYIMKDMRDEISQLKEVVKEDTKNTQELKEIIGNHLLHSIEKLGEKIDRLVEGIERRKNE